MSNSDTYMSMEELAGKWMKRPWERTRQTETRHFLGIFPYKVLTETTSEVSDIPPEVFERGAIVRDTSLRGNDIHRGESESSNILHEYYKK